MWKRFWRKKVNPDLVQTEKVILNQDGSLSLNFKNEEVVNRLLASFTDDSDAKLRYSKPQKDPAIGDVSTHVVSNYHVTQSR